MLYEENPKYLSDVLTNLTENEDIGNGVGVKFLQQQKNETSTPDGVVLQKSFTVYIETKNFDWFYDKQLEEHLSGLNKNPSEYKVLLALGNFEKTEKSKFEKIEKLCNQKYKKSIFFNAISFDDFLKAIPQESLSKNLKDTVLDFVEYLNEEDLLPKWEDLLDVVNCAGLPDDVLKGNVYMCPAAGGARSHSRCKYFGMYKNKIAEKISLIEGVVDVHSPESSLVRWKNIDKPNHEYERLAQEKIKKFRPGTYPTRVFLLGELFDTKFIKDTKGPLWGVGDHQTATNSNHVAVMVATTLGRLMVLKDTLSPYFATVVDHTIF